MFDIEELEPTNGHDKEYSVMDGMDSYLVVHEGESNYTAYKDGKAINGELAKMMVGEVHEYRVSNP